ncbi:D-alanine--D-alanine ligase family protein [Pelagibius sp. Alg239-R121]|uniref:D-alanine--D-alanine ligase family protein n=1 Tax=Pelagibius sp. Alg239-R121 TaxID=2993448 RepID=UPI0024A634DA|nr:D-alanine--D-alanine ligase family protein [Pelagibius sp. Alg239-R121]
MASRCTVVMLFGGQSAEHEVSIQSAENVGKALKKAGYKVVLVGIDKQGTWRLAPDVRAPEPAWPKVVILPGGGGEIIVLGDDPRTIQADVVFPVLHGPLGEDGSLQGLLKLANVAFVGPGVLASAVCMDKEFSKHLLNSAGIPTVKSLSFDRDGAANFSTAVRELGSPLFIKPANMGSSVGVSKAHDETEYQAALNYAFQYDTKIVVESFAEGQEIECAVLSAGGLKASLPGEIVPTSNDGFYSYDAKYLDDKGAKLVFPAKLPAEITQKVQELSLAASQALGCEGMVRVDFFLKADGELLVNELNTIPGFTAISMYPKLWEATGIPPDELVVHLVEHAITRFHRESALTSDRGS